MSRDPNRSRVDSLRHAHRYGFLLGASTISNIGDGVTLAALPLLITTLSRDPTIVAGLAFVNRLPWLLFALPVGALIDRWDRKVVMWRANAVRFSVLATLGLAVATDVHSVWTLYAAAALVGTAEVFYDNAAQTFLPSIIDEDKLHQANGRLAAAELVANGFVGPPLGAALFVAAAALPFMVDATTFGLSMLLILAIPGVYKPSAATRPEQRRLTIEIREGLRWLWRHDLIRTLALLLAVTNFVGNAALSLLVLFAEDHLGLGDIGFGLLLTAGAAGGLVGALVAGKVNKLVGPAWSLLGAYLTIGTALALIGITSSPIAAGAVFGILSFAGMVWNVVTVSARQSLIPDELLGRVNSVYRLLGWGAIPLGAAAGGILASLANLRTVFIAGGIVQLAVAAIAARSLINRARILHESQ